MPDLDALLRALTPGGGPELEDFVSASPADLPTFSGGAKEAWGEGGGGVLECRIFVDGVSPSSDPKEARAALRSVREAILASVARERGVVGWFLQPVEAMLSPSEAPLAARRRRGGRRLTG